MTVVPYRPSSFAKERVSAATPSCAADWIGLVVVGVVIVRTILLFLGRRVRAGWRVVVARETRS